MGCARCSTGVCLKMGSKIRREEETLRDVRMRDTRGPWNSPVTRTRAVTREEPQSSCCAASSISDITLFGHCRLNSTFLHNSSLCGEYYDVYTSAKQLGFRHLVFYRVTPVFVREFHLADPKLSFNFDGVCVCKYASTGTFGRVHLVKEKMGKRYFALKVMSIPDVIRLKQEQHVHNEKSVLKEVNHPFLIRFVFLQTANKDTMNIINSQLVMLVTVIGKKFHKSKRFWTNHDERFLYMLMEYVPGGELFSYLRNMGRFNNSTGLFYSTEIICAIEYLHSKEIVYRDLKPENILLDKEGHIKLTDFGFAKKLVDRTWTLCGTPEYLAPEVIQSKGHGRAVDWWALGILIFEMLSGFPPFFDDNPFGIYQKILAGKIDFPRHLDLYVKDLIKKLLVVDRTRRLGNMKNGADDVKRHRWFRSIDWDAVPQRRLKPPIVPKVSNDGDTSNFEAYPEDDWNKTPPVPPKDLEIFKNF
ncbi:cAMP-dependent protein kinase catalytic subunit PRKX [Willisornis vidua]|uniref:cAMP-dependent protein kinase catalytic subunit PRKX n=1 Tax=Willisornis vidua TaxID=1566151 RepID=A0ABQ9DGF9_9PASS|nr:cAMP-dependent protein kinase catalytic subunit PRKX [Willisornis vidua]